MYKEMFSIVEELSSVGASREFSGGFVEDIDRLGKRDLELNIEWAEKTYTIYIGDYQLMNSVNRQRLDEFFSGEHERIAVKWIKVDEVASRVFKGMFEYRTVLENKPSKEFTKEVFRYVLNNNCETYEEYRGAVMKNILKRLDLV